MLGNRFIVMSSLRFIVDSPPPPTTTPTRGQVSTATQPQHLLWSGESVESEQRPSPERVCHLATVTIPSDPTLQDTHTCVSACLWRRGL